MPKFQTVQATPPEIELTPNRRTLAELIDHRDEATKETEVLRARIARLDAAKAEVAKVNSELVALGIREQGEMLAWISADDGKPAPDLDGEKRLEIETRLARARATAAAVDGATTSVQVQAQKAGATLASIQPYIERAKAFVVLDEARAVLPDLIDAVDEVKRLQMKVAAGRELALVMVEALPADVRKPFFAVLEKFDQKEVNVMPTPRDDANERSAWFGLAAALNADATATLEVLS